LSPKSSNPALYQFLAIALLLPAMGALDLKILNLNPARPDLIRGSLALTLSCFWWLNCDEIRFETCSILDDQV